MFQSGECRPSLLVYGWVFQRFQRFFKHCKIFQSFRCSCPNLFHTCCWHQVQKHTFSKIKKKLMRLMRYCLCIFSPIEQIPKKISKCSHFPLFMFIVSFYGIGNVEEIIGRENMIRPPRDKGWHFGKYALKPKIALKTPHKNKTQNKNRFFFLTVFVQLKQTSYDMLMVNLEMLVDL